MLFSRDLAEATLIILKYLPVVETRTFAINFGFYAFHMENVTIFNDQTQICAQQGYLTTYMRGSYAEHLQEEYMKFCEKFLWAHHVKDARIVDIGVPVAVSYVSPPPTLVHPKTTCKKYGWSDDFWH